jgi:hypothetical protein
MIERYPGGREKLDEAIQGGELFQTIVYNPVSASVTSLCYVVSGHCEELSCGSNRLLLVCFCTDQVIMWPVVSCASGTRVAERWRELCVVYCQNAMSEGTIMI